MIQIRIVRIWMIIKNPHVNKKDMIEVMSFLISKSV